MLLAPVYLQEVLGAEDRRAVGARRFRPPLQLHLVVRRLEPVAAVQAVLVEIQ